MTEFQRKIRDQLGKITREIDEIRTKQKNAYLSKDWDACDRYADEAKRANEKRKALKLLMECY